MRIIFFKLVLVFTCHFASKCQVNSGNMSYLFGGGYDCFDKPDIKPDSIFKWLKFNGSRNFQNYSYNFGSNKKNYSVKITSKIDSSFFWESQIEKKQKYICIKEKCGNNNRVNYYTKRKKTHEIEISYDHNLNDQKINFFFTYNLKTKNISKLSFSGNNLTLSGKEISKGKIRVVKIKNQKEETSVISSDSLIKSLNPIITRSLPRIETILNFYN